jgi:23S rRNA (adenine1618-N6)-methyltransferase
VTVQSTYNPPIDFAVSAMTITLPAGDGKPGLHFRSVHRERYDFVALIAANPELAEFVRHNEHGIETVDFHNPAAVKALNRALLMHHYGVLFWDIPPGYLCPPVPGRADYLHHAADLLAKSNKGTIPKRATVLDIGVGANCIYPIVGRHVYGWRFVGSDIDADALRMARLIVDANPQLKSGLKLRQQTDAANVFDGIIKREDRFDLTICNPPFHGSAAEADAAARRKVANLTGQRMANVELNFGGRHHELWCEGGEEYFLATMARQSVRYGHQVAWFSSLVSKVDNVRGLLRELEMCNAKRVITLDMAQGNKISRVVAWTFLDKEAMAEWREERWEA